MGKIIKVKKSVISEAVLITDKASEFLVREWLEGMGVTDADLQDLINRRVWFMRDPGSEIVYLVPGETFEKNFEQVEEVPITEPEDELGDIPDEIKNFTFPS